MIEQLTSESDAELLAKFIECNDRAALESLIVRYAPMVAAVCRVTSNHRNDAEDAFQATFLVLLQSASKVRQQSSIAAWLHGVAFRIASRVRNQRRQQVRNSSQDCNLTNALENQVSDIDPVSVVARQMELEKLVREMECLPVKLRSALVEHYLLGFTIQEIAERMELSSSAVEGRLRRGRRLLRNRLVRQGMSLSIALSAVGLLQQQLSAAESSVWCHQFINQQLNEFCLGLGCHSSSNVGALVQGELTMSMRFFALKTAVGVAFLGSIGSVAAMAYLADRDAKFTTSPNSGNTSVVIEQTAQPKLAKELNGQFILAQSAAAEQPPGATNATSSTQNRSSAEEPNTPEPAIATNNTVSAGVASKFAAPGKNEKPVPEKIVPWKSPETPKPAWLADLESEEEIAKLIEQNRQSLRSKMIDGVSFSATPLSNVLQQFQDISGIAFFIDKTALETDGIDPDIPVTVELPPCSVRETLSVMLKPLGLTYRVREAGIEITTESAVEDGAGTLRYYDLSFIFPSSEHANTLIQAIEMSIDPDSWLNNGGSSTISMVGSVMVVKSSETTHCQIEDLLRSIAKMNPSNSTPSRPPLLEGMGGGMGAPAGGFF